MKAPSKADKERSRVTKEEWREFTKTVWHIANVSDPKHPAVFPKEIPRRLIKLFSFCGERVLDPFAGTGTTAVAALESGRHAVCVEQNPEYAKAIRARCSKVAHGSDLQVILGDSSNMEIVASGSVGLIVTSPPYWNKAEYGAGKENLGNEPIYTKFLERMRPVLQECFRVLGAGRKLCLVTANVNQHTDHGLLTFPLAADLLVVLRSVGFVVINEIIWSKDGTGGRWGSSGAQRPIFGSYPFPPNFLFKNVHEHILIVAKPPSSPTKGKTVKSYRSLLGEEEVSRPKRPTKKR